MPTKFGLIWIGLRGLKIPDKKGDITLHYVTTEVRAISAQLSLAWVWAELSNLMFLPATSTVTSTDKQCEIGEECVNQVLYCTLQYSTRTVLYCNKL